MRNSQNKSHPLSVIFILKANQEEARMAGDGEAWGPLGRPELKKAELCPGPVAQLVGVQL